MRLLVGLTLTLLASPALAADKGEDKAKEITLAFMKAAKAKDIDAVMKTVDVPFLFPEVAGKEPIKKVEDLKVKIQELLKEGYAEDIAIEIGDVHNMAAIQKMVSGANKEEYYKRIENVAGKAGFAVVVKRGEDSHAILVRIKDGQAKVVGWPK